MADPRKEIRLFERAAAQRWKAACFLYDSGFSLDGTYLAGYAVECALKALILKRTPKPEHDSMMEQLTEVGAIGHDFEYLKGLFKKQVGKTGSKDAQIFGKMHESLRMVTMWTPAMRYRVGQLKQKEAGAFFGAAEKILDWCLRS